MPKNQATRKTLNLKYLVNYLQKVIRILTIKTVTTFYRNVIVVARSIDDTIPNLQPRLPVVIAMLTQKELPDYSRFRPDQQPKAIRERFAHGDRCFVAWYEGKIVHAGWVTTKRRYVPYLQRDLILQSGDVRLYDHYTLPAYRGCGLANARGVHVLRQYREEGYHRALGIVAAENEAAFGPAKAIGYRPIGMYRCVRLGPWQWDWQQSWSDEPLPILTKEKLER